MIKATLLNAHKNPPFYDPELGVLLSIHQITHNNLAEFLSHLDDVHQIIHKNITNKLAFDSALENMKLNLQGGCIFVLPSKTTTHLYLIWTSNTHTKIRRLINLIAFA